MLTAIRLLSLVVLLSCAQGKKSPLSTLHDVTPDTTVYSEIITHGLCGPSEYRREKRFYLITGADTSDLVCVLSETLRDDDFATKGHVGMRIHFSGNKSYRQQLIVLEKVLRQAISEFSIDSLRGISGLYLSETGDLAISITKQLVDEKFQNLNSNQRVAEFLMRTRLTNDLNRIFAIYKKNVKGYAIEHASLSDSSVVINDAIIETSRDQVPPKILTGTVWVYF